MVSRCIYIIVFSFCILTVKAQNSFLEAELWGGSIVPNFPKFPKTGISRGFQLSIGETKTSDESWVNYYNKPSYGLNINYSRSSNIKELGEEFGALFFFDISPNKLQEQIWFFRFGIGATYFSQFYRKTTNERNKIIGSYWNWRFQAFLYRKIKEFEKMELRLGAGYVHSSNGHTQLPNYGMNAGMLSLSARFYKSKNPYKGFALRENKKPGTKMDFVQMSSGLGFHEYGGTTKPVGGAKKGVYSFSINYGKIYNHHFKLKTGLTYRYYQHYYDRLGDSTNNLSINRWNASNVFFLLGVEYLINHFAIDIEGGINLHKPFFEIHYKQHGGGGSIKKFLKETFPTRMGLNYYLIGDGEQSNYNMFVGVAINANLGQADFSQFKIGLVRNFNFQE